MKSDRPGNNHSSLALLAAHDELLRAHDDDDDGDRVCRPFYNLPPPAQATTIMSAKRLAHQVSATPPSPHTSRLAAAAADCRDSFTATESAAAEPMPRTTEVLWDGAAALGFTLKRKRKSGAILVSTLQESCTSRLRVGSELKLVGGFPVKQLTLAEVKKVMLHAPKPVSLVFLNLDDAAAAAQQQAQLMLQSGSQPAKLAITGSFLTDCSDDRGSFENEFGDDLALTSSAASLEPIPQEASVAFFDSAPARLPLQRAMTADFALTAPARAPLSPSASTESGFTSCTNYYAKPSAASKAKKRKVSKLRVALDRMSQLLNRPVRQSALNIPAAKSIVV